MRLDDFYADRKRADSKEVKFGSAWRLEGEGVWEVVWLEATGELVAFSVAALQGWEPSGFGGGDGFLVLELARRASGGYSAMTPGILTPTLRLSFS